MELKRHAIVDIYETLTNEFKGEYNKFFIYHVSKIKSSLEGERSAILEAGRPSDDFLDFERERRDLVLKYCEKDDDGQPIRNGNNIKVVSGLEQETQDALNDLGTRYKETLDKRKSDIQEYEIFLNEQVDVELEPIPFKYIPDNISQNVMDTLMPIIKMED